MVSAVVFDFDGLLVDTESVVLRAWEEEFERHGVAFPTDRWIRQSVGSVKGQVGYLDEYGELERLVGGPVDRDEIHGRRIARHDELLARPRANPGVERWLDDVESRGLPMGVASSSTREWVTKLLDRMGWLERFAAVVCRDDVGVPKPDPAVYRTAVERLGVSADESVALEDSPTGIAAARAAGLFAVAVPSPITRVLDFDGADHVVDSLAHFDLDALVALRGGSGPGSEGP